MMKTIKCTDAEWNTIYTALRIELERNYGGDEEIVKQLQSAAEAVRSALNSSRRV